MSLSERSRGVLYRRLTTVIEDEEAVGEMLSSIATQDDLATKDFVRAEVGALRAEMHQGFNRLLMWMITLNMAQLGVILTLTRKG